MKRRLFSILLILILCTGVLPMAASAMQIFIKLPEGSHLTLEVEPTDTILDLKAKIQDKTAVPPDLQQLRLQDNVLEDWNTLQDYSIQKDFSLHLTILPPPPKTMEITAVLPDGQSLPLEVLDADSIENVKDAIQTQTGIPAGRQLLFLNGKLLEHGRTLADYNITEGAALQLSLTPFTITFDPNGGEVSPALAQTGAGDQLNQLPDPTRDGYLFSGWYTAPEGGTAVTAATVFTGDTTLYAHWTARPMDTDSPQTGDSTGSRTWLLLSLTAAAGLALSLAGKRYYRA